MSRLIFWLGAMLLAALGAAWTASHGGAVTMRWLGYEIDTTVPMLLAAVIGLCAVSVLVAAVVRGVRTLPSRLGGRRSTLRQTQGIRVLAEGFAAVAAQETKAAQKLSAEARKLLDDHPAAMILSAYSAEASGNPQEREHYYRRLADRPDTAFMGLRGLILEASKRGDLVAVRRHGEEALALHAGAKWLAPVLIGAHLRAFAFDDARRVTDLTLKAHALDRATAARMTALIHDAESRRLLEQGSNEQALTLARAAYEKLTDFAPVVTHYAVALRHAREAKKAFAILEKAWRNAPHPALTEGLVACAGDLDAKAAESLRRVAQSHASHPEAVVLQVHAALKDDNVAEARLLARGAAYPEPTARIARLVAEVEVAGGDDHAARIWLERTLRLPASEGWACGECGHLAAEWHAHCPHCESFDSLKWRDRSQGAAPTPLSLLA